MDGDGTATAHDEILYDEDDEIFKFNSINQITASFDSTGNSHGMMLTTTSGAGGGPYLNLQSGGGIPKLLLKADTDNKYAMIGFYDLDDRDTEQATLQLERSSNRYTGATQNDFVINTAINNNLLFGYDGTVEAGFSKGRFAAYQLYPTFHNYNYGYTAGTKVYVPWNSLSEITSISYYHKQAPGVAGQLHKAVIRSESSPGNTVVAYHEAGAGSANPSTTATESETILGMTANNNGTATFSATSTFTSTDTVAVSIDPTNDQNDTIVTLWWYLDAYSLQ